MVMVLWDFFNSHKPTPGNRAYCRRPLTRFFPPMKAGDVRNARLISCTRTQFLQLDSGRQVFSLSSEAAASNAHVLFTTERRGGRGGWDFRKPALSTVIKLLLFIRYISQVRCRFITFIPYIFNNQQRNDWCERKPGMLGRGWGQDTKHQNSPGRQRI